MDWANKVGIFLAEHQDDLDAINSMLVTLPPQTGAPELAELSDYVECAFCDSPKDMGNYDTNKMAEAIFMGECKAFDVEAPKPNTSAVYYTVVKVDTLWI